jgi:TRAP-type C4-dicarboxylate transport system permease small subunit
MERLLAGLSIAVMAVLLFGDVFLREVFHISLPWAQKLSLHLMILSGSLGVSLASSAGAQLRPEVGDHVLPRLIQPSVVIFRELCTAAFCAFYAWIALKYVSQSREFGDVNVITGIPLWVVQATFPVVFAIMAIKHCIYAVMPSMRPVPAGVR